jgi:hypothetical protein
MTLEPRKDWCPESRDHVHRYCDYTYWGYVSPMCDQCGFEDTSRVLQPDLLAEIHQLRTPEERQQFRERHGLTDTFGLDAIAELQQIQERDSTENDAID